jgi:hypothetical protein
MTLDHGQPWACPKFYRKLESLLGGAGNDSASHHPGELTVSGQVQLGPICGTVLS